MPDIFTIGAQVGNQALNTGMGLLLGDINDRRQYNQQQKLQQLQIAGQKQLMDYGNVKQLEMWEKTGYAAQKRQMEAAGINPGLLYGMTGGGGQTAGSSAGSVSGANAPVGGGEAMGLMQMGIQYELLEAQKENIKADTANKQANTAKTAGVDTQAVMQGMQESVQRIDVMKQDIKNKQAEEAYTKVQTAIANLSLALDAESYDARRDRIEYETRVAFRNVEIADAEAYIKRVTRNNVIMEIQQNAIGAVISNELMAAQVAKTKLEAWKIGYEVSKILNDIFISGKQVEQKDIENAIKKQLADFDTDMVNKITLALVGQVGGIISAGTKAGKSIY